MRHLFLPMAGLFFLGPVAASAQTNRHEPGSARGAAGGDMTCCELFDLRQIGRVGDVVGLSAATTSWNVGDADLMWFNVPDEEHPFIAMNLYRLKDDLFEQIGQSWVKHGFFALNDTQCGGTCTYEPGHGVGDWLGMGCTDTYGSGLNANQDLLGPRYEVNPWTGEWSYAGSHFTLLDAHDAISHRLQVHDDDLDPALNSGALYFLEGYYVILDDVNVMNSAAWKPVTPIGNPGGTWNFQMSNRNVPPNIGFAIDAWIGATQTSIAQEMPPIEFQSADGRCVLAGKAAAMNDGFWRYSYALLNIDMDRQVGGFQVPIAPGATVRNLGFHAVRHHDEPSNSPGGVPIDNADWTASVNGAVAWSTATNPLRWGTLYNFRFEVNSAPIDDAEITITHFKPGDPSTLSTGTLGPSPESPDCNGNMSPDLEEIATDPGADCNGNFVLDICELDPANDSDGDGVLDECDRCPLDADDDSDSDGVCDSDDACPGFDDGADEDGDGAPDDCDPCPFDHPDDSDGDGVCDSDDACPGMDDSADADGDGVPNECDPCPENNPDDTDGDGVCDANDICPGVDDAVAAASGCPTAPDIFSGDQCEATNPLEALLQAVFGCCGPQTAMPMALIAAGLVHMRSSIRRRTRK